MSPSLHELASRWLAEGRAAVVVEVESTRGSAPRAAGARMLVRLHDCVGSIGGGHLEWQAIAAARRRLRGDGSVPERLHFTLGPSLGQCCGGAVVLRLAALDADTLARWPAAPPRFTLQLHGAGHVGRAVVRLLEGLDCRVQWVDERDDTFVGEAPLARVEPIAAADAVAEVGRAAPGTHFLVMTHRHDLDLALVEAVLRRGDFGFLGLIGSRTKRERFVHRLHTRGFGDAALARLHCPVGVPGIEGKEPEVIAIAVVAQLLALPAAA